MPDASHPAQRWDQFRELMPVSRKWAYFDNAAVGPLPTPTRDAVLRWADEGWKEGDTVWPQWAAEIERTRRTAAEMIAASTEEIALVPNTTTGINLVAEGYPWREGENVVALANEFPSNLYPWMNLAPRGVETRLVPVDDDVQPDLDRLLAACDDKTRLITISWVGYVSGYRINVKQVVEAAHDRGILVMLDAIQGLGVYPLDVRDTNVDFATADGHKWMLGPEGAGILYVRHDHLRTLRPLNLGWNSVVHKYDYSRIELNLVDSAARYEGGSTNMVGFLGLGASLKMLSELGVGPRESPVGERVLEISDMACERLREVGANIFSDRGDSNRSGIVAFEMPGQDLTALRQRCLDNGVALAHRAGRLRISPHAYCNEDDVQRLVTTLR